VATAPEPKEYAGAERFPRAGPPSPAKAWNIRGPAYSSNRVARYMQRRRTSAAVREISGRPDGPVCGIVYADFREFPFYALR
jgi:hypothetical protein